jgi:hypothetical protein
MNWLRELFKSAYTLRLEAECERLLEENRALLNTVLGHAGVAPVGFQEVSGPPKIRRSGLSWHQRQRKTERKSLQALFNRVQAQRAKEKSDAA